MRIDSRFHVRGCVLAALCGVSIQSAFALDCPAPPAQSAKDWDTTVKAAVAKIGPVTGGELESRVKSATTEVLSKYPQSNTLYLEQMMFASYCSALRDDRTLQEAAKARLISEYGRTLRASLHAQTAPSKPLLEPKASSHLTPPPRQSVTQGAGSIAQIGGTGNTATVYNVPPEAKITLRYRTQQIQNLDGSVSYRADIEINTDRTVVAPQMTITCDAPCAFTSMNLGVDALSGTNRQVSDDTVEIGLMNPLSSNQTLNVVLNSRNPFHVVSLAKR